MIQKTIINSFIIIIIATAIVISTVFFIELEINKNSINSTLNRFLNQKY